MTFFTLFSHLPLSLIHKRTWHLDPKRWLFWDISLPSSQSASFLNKVGFLASTPYPCDSLASCAVSTVGLNMVTSWRYALLSPNPWRLSHWTHLITEGKVFIKVQWFPLPSLLRHPSRRMRLSFCSPPNSFPSWSDCFRGSQSDWDLKQPDPELSHQEMPFLEWLLLCCLAFGQLLSFSRAALPKDILFLGTLVLQGVNLLSVKKFCGHMLLGNGGLKNVDKVS